MTSCTDINNAIKDDLCAGFYLKSTDCKYFFFKFIINTNHSKLFCFCYFVKNVFFLILIFLKHKKPKVFGRCMIVQGGECTLLLNKERSKLRKNRDTLDGNNTYDAYSAALISEPECKIKQALPAQTLLRKSHDQTESFLGRFIGNSLAHITNATQTQEVFGSYTFNQCLHFVNKIVVAFFIF